MKDMGAEKFSPRPLSQSRIMDHPPVVPVSGMGLRTPDRQPGKRKKSHKLRNSLLMTGALGAAGGGIYLGTKGGDESSTTNSTVVTTVDVTPTIDPGTTVLEPATTLPDGVVERRDGYDVLANGGLLYPVDSLTIDGKEIDTSAFGGFELHLQSDNVTFGFVPGVNGGGRRMLEDTLWTFAAQHSEFLGPDQKPDIAAYVKYLEENDWVDKVFLARNLDPKAPNPPVEKSQEIILDLKQPMFYSNNGIGAIDGLVPEQYNFYNAFDISSANFVFGITESGQLFYAASEISSGGEIRPFGMTPNAYSSINEGFGIIASVTSRITYLEGSPEKQWENPTTEYYRELMNPNEESKVDYPVLNILNYLDRVTGLDKVLAQVESA